MLMFAEAKRSASGTPVILPCRGPAFSGGPGAGTFVFAGVTLFTLFFASSVASHAAPILFDRALPGSPAVKHVKSMRELRFQNMVAQRTDFSCGAAAVATILKYFYGRDTTEHEVIDGMLKAADARAVHERGFSMLDIKRYTEALGMRGRGYQVAPYMLESIKIPVIVLLNVNGYQHFVILKKTINNAEHPHGIVHLADPVLGNRIMKKEDFLLAWNGIAFAVIGPGVIADSVLINPAPPVTARALRGIHATLKPHELLEYGFKHADFF